MSLGGIYTLIAIGHTVVYDALRLISFAHADVMMVGTSNTLFLFSSVGLSFGIAVFLTLGLCGLFGILTDRVAYRPLRQASEVSMLITAIGASLFLEDLFNVMFGGSSRFFSASNLFGQTRAFGSAIIIDVVWIVSLITVLLLLAVPWLLHHTHYEMAIRTVAFDVSTMHLVGIDANRIISLVFVLGNSLTALGGVFYSISYPTINPLMNVPISLGAFATAVLGGIDSITGTVLDGFTLGSIGMAAVTIFPELGGYKNAFTFLFSILILLFRPAGIMGDERLERNRF